MIQIRIAIITTITIIPTTTPALKIPVITEQLLSNVTVSKTSNKLNFFIVELKGNIHCLIQIFFSDILFFLKKNGNKFL